MKKFLNATLVTLLCLSYQANVNAQETILGLDNNNSIVSILSNATAVGAPVPVTGLAAGDNLVGIDFRSGTREIYAIGSLNNVYTLSQTGFGATLVGNFADGVNDDPANVGALSGNQFAFDFNPALTTAGEPRGTFARIISDTNTNRVINGNTGEYLGGPKTDVFFAAGDANEGATPNIQGIAYTNSVFAPTSTQQYGIDTTQNQLVTVANNAGTLGTVGTLGSVFSGEVGFDISGATNIAYATSEAGGLGSNLFTVDLTNGSTTNLGSFGVGNSIRSLAVIAVPEPSSVSLLALGFAAIASRRRRN